MRELGIFNTVRIIDPMEISHRDFKDIKYGGLLTLSQSGDDKDLIEALRLAYKSNLTCFNVVNQENSPITKTIEKIHAEEKEEAKKNKP